MQEKCPTAPFYWISGAWAWGTSAQCSLERIQPHQADALNDEKGNSDKWEESVVLFHEQ